ncbi:MAG TPA: SusC/RagA family protein, partial [Cytophagales bacterium]|nr:SusC/RagA family protein [Cytophagales bacterium]
IDSNDRTNIGNPTPDFTYGLFANLNYKNLTVSVDFMGSYGAEIYRVWGTSEQKNSVYNYPANYMNGWTEAGSSNLIPIVNQTHLINRAPSTYGIEDGSFFRVRNVSVGYNFTSLLNLDAIKKATLTLGIQNLVTWKRNSGYSPEYAGDATSFGIDYGSASSALPRITSLGLNVTF